jgi:hypothetical protein
MVPFAALKTPCLSRLQIDHSMSEQNARRLRKLPARYAAIVQPMILAAIMTFVVSGIATVRVLGPGQGFFGAWMVSWAISWIVAFPTMILALPYVRRLVALIVDVPAPK